MCCIQQRDRQLHSGSSPVPVSHFRIAERDHQTAITSFHGARCQGCPPTSALEQTCNGFGSGTFSEGITIALSLHSAPKHTHMSPWNQWHDTALLLIRGTTLTHEIRLPGSQLLFPQEHWFSPPGYQTSLPASQYFAQAWTPKPKTSVGTWF